MESRNSFSVGVEKKNETGSSRTKIYSLTWRESGLNLSIMLFLRRESSETKRDTTFVPLQQLTKTFVLLCFEQ